jgi:ABC-type antimicrobial peptide transport system permease subunit
MDISSVSPVSTSEAYIRVLDGLRALPGVSAVGATDQLPLAGNSTFSSVRTSERSELSIKVRHVLPGYVSAAGIPLVSGRDIRESDRSGDTISAALINSDAARRLFPGTMPLGQRLTYEGQDLEVVGILGDIRHRGPLRPVDPELYLPFRPKDVVSTGLGLTIVIRRDRRIPLSNQQLRSAARAERLFVVERIRSGKEVYDALIVRDRQRTTLMAVVAALGLIIALVGVVSVTSYATARRGKEIALRVAFGAARHELIAAAVWDSVAPGLIGIMSGLLAALLLTRVLRTFLFETGPTDALSFLAAAAAMAIATAIAAWVPSRLAVHAEPAQLLRGE